MFDVAVSIKTSFRAKIELIKILREATYMSLKEAKDLLDDWMMPGQSIFVQASEHYKGGHILLTSEELEKFCTLLDEHKDFFSLTISYASPKTTREVFDQKMRDLEKRITRAQDDLRYLEREKEDLIKRFEEKRIPLDSPSPQKKGPGFGVGYD